MKKSLRTFKIDWREVEDGSFYEQHWQSTTREGAYRRWARFWGHTKDTVAMFAMIEIKEGVAA